MTEHDAMAPLERLLGVQDLDTLISQLEHRRATLAERAALASVTAELSEITARTETSEGQRAELAARQTQLDGEISAAGRRLAAIEERLYAARGAPARDLEAMEKEVQHLRNKRAELEDAELEIMVALDPLEAELASLASAREAANERATALATALAQEEESIDAELERQRAARALEAGGLPADLAKRYEELRRRLGGVGAARLVANRCSGCHLELPSMEVERIRRLPPGSVATCEQCGRLLVPV